MRRCRVLSASRVFDPEDTARSLASVSSASLVLPPSPARRVQTNEGLFLDGWSTSRWCPLLLIVVLQAWRAGVGTALRYMPSVAKGGLGLCAQFPGTLGVLGRRALDGHFVGGATLLDCADLARRLRPQGVGCIVDQCREDAKEDELAGNAASFGTFLQEWAKVEGDACSGGSTTENNDDERAAPPMVPLKPSTVASAGMLERLAAAIQAQRDPTAARVDAAVLVALSKADRQDYDAARDRLAAICATAALSGVAVLLDAERWARQPAVDHLALALAQGFPPMGKKPLLYNTYQAYLDGSEDRLAHDLDFVASPAFGAKVVRGAYLESERAAGAALRASKEETDAAYDRMLKLAIGRAPVVVATHNAASCARALQLVKEASSSPPRTRPSSSSSSSSSTVLPDDHDGDAPSSSAPPAVLVVVTFAQILGLCDSLTLALAAAGADVRKLVLFGPLRDLAPWFSRRIDEHRDGLGSPLGETRLVATELARRLGFSQRQAARSYSTKLATANGRLPLLNNGTSSSSEGLNKKKQQQQLAARRSVARTLWSGAISMRYTGQRPVMVFTAGAPGSGKTYVLHHLYGLENIEMLDLDPEMAAHPAFNSRAPHEIYDRRDAYLWANERVEEKFQRVIARPRNRNGDPKIIAFDGTGTRVERQLRRIREAKAAGFFIQLLDVRVSLATCLERNRLRDRTVPEPVLRDYIARLDGAVNAVLDVPDLVDLAVSINNDTRDTYDSETQRWGDYLDWVKRTSQSHSRLFDPTDDWDRHTAIHTPHQ